MLLLLEIKQTIVCALFHKDIILMSVSTELDTKISDVLDSADRMVIATSVGGNSSGASVFGSKNCS